MSPICSLFGRVNLPEFGSKLIAQSGRWLRAEDWLGGDLRQFSHRDYLETVEWNTLGRRSGGQAFQTQVSPLQMPGLLVR
jgi:hypothetical protein